MTYYSVTITNEDGTAGDSVPVKAGNATEAVAKAIDMTPPINERVGEVVEISKDAYNAMRQPASPPA